MRRPPSHARLLALLATLPLLRPGSVLAAPVAAPQELAAFEAGFTEGQAQYDRGEFLEAARTWVRAAERLRETTANRDNRSAVYEYAADAFVRGLAGSTDPAALREAVDALRLHGDSFTRAYGTETAVSARITGPREALEKQLADAEAAQLNAPPVEPREDRAPTDTPEPTDTPSGGKPWKGLVIGGGVAAGLGLGAAVMAGVGGVRGRSFEAKFDDPANMCVLSAQTPRCAEFYDAGKSSNAMTIAGAIAAPLLVGAGVTLLVVGLKRRDASRSARTALVPTFVPGFAGFTLSGRF